MRTADEAEDQTDPALTSILSLSPSCSSEAVGDGARDNADLSGNGTEAGGIDAGRFEGF